MPKISAPSVAEHRTQQRTALVAAAREMLLAEGLSAVTPARVAQRAGLARSSFYEYFPSALDLLTEVAIADSRAWARELGAMVMAVDSGEERLAVYIRATVHMVAEGKHAIADAMTGVAYTAELQQRIHELHTELAAPLHAAISDLALDDPRLQAALIQGVIDAAMTRVSAGDPVATVATTAIDLVLRGIRRG